MGAILRAVDVPPSGGDTLFCDMYSAYEGLDETTRDAIDDLIAVHDYSQVFGNHLLKVGLLGSMNAKNEDNGGGSPAEAPQFWGATGLNGWGANTGNILSDFLLKDMTFGFSEANGEAGPGTDARNALNRGGKGVRSPADGLL